MHQHGRTVEAILGELAGVQHGVVSRRELLRVGLSARILIEPANGAMIERLHLPAEDIKA